MDLRKHERLTAFLCLIAVSISSDLICANPAMSTQDEAWVRLKKSGQVADVGADYTKAASLYAQALNQITTKDESQILDLEARLATDYIHLFDFDRAEPLARHVAAALPALKKSKKYDPELLVSVKFLSEAYRQTSKGSLPMAQRQKNFNHFEPRSLLFADLVAPNDDAIYAGHYDRARQYIYFAEPAQAVMKLGMLLQMVPKTSSWHQDAELAQAAVECTLKKPQKMEKLQLELSKKYDEPTTLIYVGRAHLYAANYLEADRVLEKALALLAAKKPKDVNAQIEVHRLIMNSCDDRLLFAKSEPHARKVCELVEHSKGTKSDEYTKSVNKLVFYLNNLKKTDEAKKWKAKIPNSYDWLLDDEKKANH